MSCCLMWPTMASSDHAETSTKFSTMPAIRGRYAVPSHGLVVYRKTLNRARSCIPNTFCIRCDSGWLLLASKVERETDTDTENATDTATDTENENGARSARVDRERPEGEGEGAPT